MSVYASECVCVVVAKSKHAHTHITVTTCGGTECNNNNEDRTVYKCNRRIESLRFNSFT